MYIRNDPILNWKLHNPRRHIYFHSWNLMLGNGDGNGITLREITFDIRRNDV